MHLRFLVVGVTPSRVLSLVKAGANLSIIWNFNIHAWAAFSLRPAYYCVGDSRIDCFWERIHSDSGPRGLACHQRTFLSGDRRSQLRLLLSLSFSITHPIITHILCPVIFWYFGFFSKPWLRVIRAMASWIHLSIEVWPYPPSFHCFGPLATFSTHGISLYKFRSGPWSMCVMH